MNDAALFASRLAEANAAPAFRQDATPEVLQPVVQSRMSPEAREDAILRAGHLVEFFQAERECFEALHKRSGCFGHKGSADAARLNARKAGELMAALINGRSPEYVAKLEQERGLA